MIILMFNFTLFVSPMISGYTNEYDIKINNHNKLVDEKILLDFNFPKNNYAKGFTLFAPERSTKTYLINLDKEVFYTWNSTYRPGLAAYLLNSGSLIRTTFLGAHPIFYAGGMGGGIEEIDYNNNVIWNFEYVNDTHLSHHDIEPMPNGNILMIAWEYKSTNESIEAGRNPDFIPQDSGLWPDHIIEVEPTGPTHGEIVWEWHVWDHLIQDYDPTKDNYGIVKDHPELIDINYLRDIQNINPDWNHLNSVDYNEEFDQILISCPSFDEIWIIDHSTTTEEAAGHTGGNSGMGGDLLYRWGNPRTYRAGSSFDQWFWAQHDAQWIEAGCPGEGNILVFNNGNGRPGVEYSSIDEIVPPVDSNGNYYREPGNPYGPVEPVWSYKAENPEDFYSGGRSGAQRMPNGNTLICDSDDGYFFEVTTNSEIVWDYLNPYPEYSNNGVFKIHRYDENYSGIQVLFKPPNIPNVPIGPNVGEKGTKYPYITNTTDPNSDDIFYLFDWGDGTQSEWLGPFKSGQICIVSNIWYEDGSFDIKVKAKDIYDFESDWSVSLRVNIGSISPDVPVISGPTNGKPGAEYDFIFVSEDPNNNDISYFIDWGDGTTTGWTDYVKSGEEILLTHSWKEGVYNVKCKAKDLAQNESDWGTLRINIPRSRATIFYDWFRFLEISVLLSKLLYFII